jgi:hypothetical protein
MDVTLSALPKTDRKNLESLANNNFSIEDVKIKSPNNHASSHTTLLVPHKFYGEIIRLTANAYNSWLPGNNLDEKMVL